MMFFLKLFMVFSICVTLSASAIENRAEYDDAKNITYFDKAFTIALIGSLDETKQIVKSKATQKPKSNIDYVPISKIDKLVKKATTVALAHESNKPTKNSKPEDEVEKDIAVEKSQEFTEATKLFKAREYQAAYDKFYTIFLNNLRNPNVNFYLGQAAFMLKRYDEAISAYERVLFIDDNAIRVKLELARSFMANGSYQQAKEIFLDTLKLEIPKNVRENVNKYLQALDDRDVKNSVSGVLIVGFGWDDNVEALSTGYTSEVTDAVFVSTNSLESKYSHQEVLALNHVYKYSDTINFKNDALFFTKTVLGLSARNIQFIQYTPALSVLYSNKLSVDYALSYNRVWLDTKSLITNYAINPKLKYLYSKELILGASLKYQQKFNDDSNNRGRDAKYSELSLSAQTIHTDKISSLTEFKVASERKIRGSITDVDYEQYTFSSGVIYKKDDKLSFSLKGVLYHKPYVDNFTPTKAKRVDDEYQAYLGATYILSKKYVLQAEYIFTEHKSNYNDFEFKKNSFTMNFISLF